VGFKAGPWKFRVSVNPEYGKREQVEKQIQQHFGDDCEIDSSTQGSMRVTVNRIRGWYHSDTGVLNELQTQGMIIDWNKFYVSGNPKDTNEIPGDHEWCGRCGGYYIPHSH
jgi:hypothetical protein